MMMNEVNNAGNVTGLESTSTQAIDETTLEKTIGLELLADYNEQLSEIAESMQENLNQKKEVGEELKTLQTAYTQPADENGNITLSEDQADALKALDESLVEEIENEDGTTSQVATKSKIEIAILQKQQEQADLNSNSEMISIQIQSLIDQRKQALTMLSNLLASRNEILMNIVRNIK